MKHDLLSDMFYVISNAENMGKHDCEVPASILIKDVLTVMQKSGYVGEFEFVDNGKSGFFRVDLVGRINKSKVVKPRFPVKKDEFEKWETRYLPAKGFGILIVSTPHGIMTQNDASKQGMGGRILGFVY